MVRLALFSSVIVAALAVTPLGLAGPACARRNAGTTECFSRCKSKWGWSGRTMGTDPWGNVMTRTVTDDMGNVLTKACRVRSSTSSSVASSTSVPGIAQNVGQQVSSAEASPSTSSVEIFLSSSSVVTPTSIITTVEPITTSLASITTHSTSSTHLLVHLSSSVEAPSVKPTVSPSITPVTTKPQTSTKIIVQSQHAAPPAPSSSAAAPPPPPPSTTAHATTHAPPPPPQAATQAQSSSDSTSQSDIDQYLSAHNTVRAQHGAAPLTWSDEAASKAQQWANGCVFKHSGGTLGPFGENLAAGTGSSYDIATAVKSWTDEVSQYDPNNPQPSHFTQVVWKATTQVGCAVQLCDGIFDPSFGKAKYFVCEYSSQGNVIGEFSQNVQA